ncbi:MAG TPA: ATP-binding protein [Methylomirabilota bacterium]|nr:ATP-binding protein [Methylomirabilota bacterium]
MSSAAPEKKTQHAETLVSDGHPQDKDLPKKQRAIGCTSATENEANSSDEFHFWLAHDTICNPFDIVETDQVSYAGPEKTTKTYGLVTNIDHVTDAAGHLSNYISSNFGDVAEVPNTPRQGADIADVNVLSNDADIYMPVPSGRHVRFADQQGIYRALGIDVLMTERPRDAIPAGLIRLSNGEAATAYLDSRYLLGPESAHVNITGISGLATKTSYAMFLIQAILQTTANPENIAVILLNVKHGDLLHIDEDPAKKLPPDQIQLWESLRLQPKTFSTGSVHYYVPRSKRRGQPNSYAPPDPTKYAIYAYDWHNTADKLDFLFTEVPDAYGTLESILSELKEGFRTGDRELNSIKSFDDLITKPPLFDPATGSPPKNGWRNIRPSSIGVFRRHIRRMVLTGSSGLFVPGAMGGKEKDLSEEFRKIKGGHVYVVDIAKLHDHEQCLVFGDILKTLYQVKAEGVEDEKTGDVNPGPEKIIFFVDELNKYAPRGRQTSPITDQILEIAERGRSLGVILLSAEQFMSAVHERVTGNCATKILGRTGSSEVAASDYRFLGDDIKLNMTRLAKGELLVSHAIYRQPVKVIFPLPAYKQLE